MLDVVVLVVLVAGLALLYYRHESLRDWVRPVEDAVQGSVQDLASQIVVDLGERLDSLKEFDNLSTAKVRLEQEVAELERSKREIEETFNRKQADLDHRVGLLRTQLEEELKHAESRYELGAEKKILAAEKKAFEQAQQQVMEQMKERLEFVEGYAEKIMDLVPRLEAQLKIRENRESVGG